MIFYFIKQVPPLATVLYCFIDILFYLADSSLGYGPVLFYDILFYLADPSLGYGPVLFHDILFYFI